MRVKIRQTSKGMDGTYRNIAHHAEHIRKPVDILRRSIENLDDDKILWRQGHNIHHLHKVDNKKLVISNGNISGWSDSEALTFLYKNRKIEVWRSKYKSYNSYSYIEKLATIEDEPNAVLFTNTIKTTFR